MTKTQKRIITSFEDIPIHSPTYHFFQIADTDGKVNRNEFFRKITANGAEVFENVGGKLIKINNVKAFFKPYDQVVIKYVLSKK
ncbi:MAG: hypothetical protein GF349_02410 [Candidatus Magasanikbacteria bacterium]|nr:hypothetical protein [Candidatus Magasanikbacteria bacterium]